LVEHLVILVIARVFLEG